MSAQSPRRTRQRVLSTALAIVVLVAGSTVAAMWKPWESHPAAEETATTATVTVPVELGTLTNKLKLNAALGYGDPVELPAVAGVLTALPAPGQVIEAGQQVYEADGRPIILLEGARPFWRELSAEVTAGPDVLQLEQNLARLGFFDAEPDARFDWVTREAVRRWQTDLGVPATGTVAVSDVVVVAAPSIRISQLTGQLGQTELSPATYTATTLTAVAKLTAAQARELSAATPVTVELPDGTELENTIAAVDPGGQPTGEEGQMSPPTATIEFPEQEQVAATGPAAIRVTVQNTQESEETLVVPATALMATAQNGYAVEVLQGDLVVRVPVRIGLIADARVQVLASGPDVDGAPSDAPVLSAGDEVVISR